MNIHFICSGNTYRSRLAEAYLRSLGLKKVQVSSSGFLAKYEDVPVRWYSEKILEEKGLSEFASKEPRQTTRENLRSSDLLVFFEKLHFDLANKLLDLQKKKIEILNIPDINPVRENDQQIILETKKTFYQIEKAVKHIIAKYSLT